MTEQDDREQQANAGTIPPPIPPSNHIKMSDDEQEVAPAEFPCGFWRGVDYLLHHPENVLESLRRDDNLPRLIRIFLAISLIMSAIYGAVMGATNLFQGSHMALADKFLMILVTAVKVPVLYLVTFVIVLPPIYVSNAFVGARLSIRQMVAAILAALAITTTVLASTATVAAFFALTSVSYSFIKLLHVVFFAYSGMAGLRYLSRSMTAMVADQTRPIPGMLFALWLALYMFVGTQMAWVLRPFVGSPDMQFQVFRPRSGNFYECVSYSIRDMFTEKR